MKPDHFLRYWYDCHSDGRGGGLRTDRYFGIQSDFDAALDDLYRTWYDSGAGGWWRYRDVV